MEPLFNSPRACRRLLLVVGFGLLGFFGDVVAGLVGGFAGGVHRAFDGVAGVIGGGGGRIGGVVGGSRSEESRVGKGWGRTCRTRGSRDNSKKTTKREEMRSAAT